jgi:cell division protein FtsL
VRKVLLIILLLLCAGSIGFAVYNYMNYIDYNKKIDSVKEDISKMKDSINDEEKIKKNKEEEYNKFIEENKSKIEEIEEWENKAKKVKELL